MIFKTNPSCQFLQLKTIFVQPLPYRMDPLRDSVAAGDPAVLPHSQVDDPTFPILLFASRIHHCRAHLVGPAQAMNFGANDPSFSTGPNIRRSQEVYSIGYQDTIPVIPRSELSMTSCSRHFIGLQGLEINLSTRCIHVVSPEKSTLVVDEKLESTPKVKSLNSRNQGTQNRSFPY